MLTRYFAPALVAAILPVAAHAQIANAPADSVYSGDFLTIGAGGVYAPSYEGSNNMQAAAIPLVLGRFHGITISPRTDGIALNLIPQPKDGKIGFTFGPLGTYNSNRHSNIDDPVVRAAGKLKTAIDLGFSAGVSMYKVLDPYDSLSATADVTWNVNGSYRGTIVSPSISYFTPVSKGALAQLSISAKHVSNNYATYYYDVTPVQSLASGLPEYYAHSGWAGISANLIFDYDLDHNLLNGGFSLIGLVGYERLIGDARDNPYTSIRGSANQWSFGAGVAYTF